MRHNKTLSFTSLVLAACLVAVASVSAGPKKGPIAFDIRGESSVTSGTKPTCIGASSCLTYETSLQNVSIGKMKNLDFNFTWTQGAREYDLPDGGSCYSADGTGTITKGSSTVFNVEGSGPFCTSTDGSEAFTKFAIALTGEGDATGLSGVADAAAIIRFTELLTAIDMVGSIDD